MIASARTFYNRVINNFGWHFALVLASVYGVIRGVTGQISGSAVLPYFKSLNVSGERYQSYVTAAMIPWSMKAALGILSDAVPVFGYHKVSYILLVSAFGSIAFALLGFVQLTEAFAPLAAVLLFLTNFQMAFVDLLTEGKYAELMVSQPQSGSDLVTFAWGLLNVGSFFGAFVGGPMADHFNPRYIFLVCLPLAAQIIIPVANGWFPDPRLPPHRRGIRMDKVRAHPDLFKLSLCMTVCAFAVGTSALLGSSRTQTAVSLVAAAILCVLGIIWLPRTVGRANLYMFLSGLLYLSIGGPMDYWFTANEECVPGGPAFSFTFYNTYASLVGSLAGALGVLAFQRFLSRGTFRFAFAFTTFLIVLASLPDLIMVKRLNLRFGVPDTVAFMLGDAVIAPVVGMLNTMPAVVLTSKVCPRGMEASMFSLLASYQNVGSAAARDIGVGLADFLGIRTVKPCNFDNLPLAIVIAHVILPLLQLPLIYFLIPDAKITDDLLNQADSAETANSTEYSSVGSSSGELIPPEVDDVNQPLQPESAATEFAQHSSQPDNEGRADEDTHNR